MSHEPQFALGQSIGLAAFVWGYPLIETLRTCRLQAVDEGRGAAWRSPVDRLHHSVNVSTDADRDVVTPANDLLYTTGWLHLADGPRVLTVPASARHGGRYFVLALYDAWTNNFANPGFRESPPDGETVVLVGPDTPVDTPVDTTVDTRVSAPWPAGARVIRSPTNLVWLIGRVVAGAGDDVLAARLLQADIALQCAAGTDHGRLPLGVQHWAGPVEDTLAALQARPHDAGSIAAHFFTNLCRGLADQAIAPADAGLAAWFARAGLLPSAQFDVMQLAEPLRAGLVKGLLDAAAWVEQAARSRRAKPWAANYQIGRYGSDYFVRALTAFKGLGALAAEEAVYAMSDFDAEGQPLDGRQHYLQRFAPGDLPPVDGFWSVTLYDANRFLYRNPFGRHAIGDRTPGLKRDADGGLTLRISHETPADLSNWLPAPAGPCYLVLRLYVPQPQARSWVIPPLRRQAMKGQA